MGTRKAGEQNVRNLTQNTTGTYQISLPISMVRDLKWKEGQKLTVQKQGKNLIVRDWKN